MNNDKALSDTMDINVEQARKAVGSLFDDEGGDEEEIVSGYDKPYNQRIDPEDEQLIEKTPYAQDDDVETDEGDWQDEVAWPENEWQEDDTGHRAAAPERGQQAPLPRPALKVNPSVPAASRTPVRPQRPQAYEADMPRETPPPKTRAVRSRYVFIEEEDDEFASFRRKYKERDRKPAKEIEKPQMWNDKPVMPRKMPESSGGSDPGFASAQAGRLPRRKRQPDEVTYADLTAPDEYVSFGMPGFFRLAIIGFTVILLLMMGFLIYRNSVLGGQLSDANELLLRLPELEAELTDALIDLEEANENLAAAEAEILVLSAQQQGPGTALGYILSDEVNGTDAPYDGQDVTDADVPAPAIPGAARIHTVVSGDNLSRIARQFYGTDSHANIQRIINANNIADPNNIYVGMQLTIPY